MKCKAEREHPPMNPEQIQAYILASLPDTFESLRLKLTEKQRSKPDRYNKAINDALLMLSKKGKITSEILGTTVVYRKA